MKRKYVHRTWETEPDRTQYPFCEKVLNERLRMMSGGYFVSITSWRGKDFIWAPLGRKSYEVPEGSEILLADTEAKAGLESTNRGVHAEHLIKRLLETKDRPRALWSLELKLRRELGRWDMAGHSLSESGPGIMSWDYIGMNEFDDAENEKALEREIALGITDYDF